MRITATRATISNTADCLVCKQPSDRVLAIKNEYEIQWRMFPTHDKCYELIQSIKASDPFPTIEVVVK